MQTKANQRRRTKVAKYVGIYRSSSGNYEFQFRDSDGRLRFETVGPNQQEAVNARADKLARMRKGERVAPTKQTFAEFATAWLDAQQQLRPRTREWYAIAIRKHLSPRLGNRKLESITVDDVAMVIAEMRREGLAAWTIRGVLTPLGQIMGNAARHGMIAHNPVRKLVRGERPTVERREMRILAPEEIPSLLAAAGRYRPLLATAVFTGARLGEVLGLTWADINFDAGIVRIRKQADRQGRRVAPKTAQAVRDIVLMPALAKMLKEHRMASPFKAEGDFVFASSVGTALGHRNVSRRGLEPAVAAAGLNGEPKLRFHDLRHTFASLLIAEGLNVKFVSGQLGHASPDITLRVYAHQFDQAEHASRASKALEKSYGAMLDVNTLSKSGRNQPQAEVLEMAQPSGLSG